MKKIILLIMLVALSTGLFACGKSESSLVISKIYDATEQANNAIELYNITDEDVDLKDYVLNFYTNGDTEISKSMDLTGTIASSDYFVVASSQATNQTLIENRDFSYEEGTMPFNGNDIIELAYKGNAVDRVGQEGIAIEYAKDLTLIRLGEKETYQPSPVFYEFDYIYYLPDLFEYLKNDDYEIKTLEDLYEGPRLEERYLDMPYVDPDNSNLGGGGAVETVLTGIADGDTAYFRGTSGFAGGSMRYFYLNTPEVNGTYVSAEPWGYVASKYNKEYLLVDSAEKTIHVQSMKGYSLTEVNNRSLGLVWINGYLSQFLIVSEGLSEDVGITYSAHDLAISYKNVPILTFLRFVEERAIINGWATKGYPSNPDGEKSPDWNYTTSGSGSNTTTNPVWEPHLPLPWA